ELRTVAFRFALLRVGTDEPYKCYGIEIGHFLLPFFLPRFSLGHERERGGVESQASVCIVGGNPVLLRAEPTKQKTRRPERRGITRAVSPKKIGEERKQMYYLGNIGIKRAPEPSQRSPKCRTAHAGKLAE